ncbi:MAG TPA: DUF2948 family protein [Asticcacaulis sp.]|nr:DUF2948 family protein [Asticcacaulis sp.]
MFGLGKAPDKPLRLLAHEAEDVPPISALLQDAALRAGDLAYDPKGRHFTVRMNRYCHESAAGVPLRAPSVLRISGVQKVQTRGVDVNQATQPLSLLDISIEPEGEAPSHVLTLRFAGATGRDVRLEVECVDILLLDLAAPRRAKSKPRHQVE